MVKNFRFTDFLDSHLQNLRAFSSQFYAAGLDMMACDFMKNALPPMLTQGNIFVH